MSFSWTRIAFVAAFATGLLLAGPARADDRTVCAAARSSFAAIAACTRVINSGDRSPYLYYNRGYNEQRWGDIGRAIADYTEAIRLEPGNSYYLSERSDALRLKGDYDLAIADATVAIKLNPAVFRAFASRGDALRRKGNLEGALADLNQAIRLNPEIPSLYSYRGAALALHGDGNQAREDFKKGLALNITGQDDKGIRETLKAQLSALPALPLQPTQPRIGQTGIAPSSAQVVAAPAVDSAPADPAWSACTQFSSEFDKGIAACTEFLARGTRETTESRSKAHQRRGVYYSLKRDYERAIADQTEALRLDPKNANAYLSRAGDYRMKDENDRALADYTDGLRLQPADVNALVFRGHIYLDRHDYDLAIADYTEALRLSPRYTSAYYRRGNAYRGKGQYDQAIADYTIWLKEIRGDAYGYLRRGQAYAAKNDFDRAIADYKEALRMDPALDEAKQNLEQATTRLASKPPATLEAGAAALSLAIKPASNDRRIALVIGNSGYRNVPALPNPRRDAASVAESLRKTGFQTVTLQNDLSREALIGALRDFAQLAEKADWAVVYYAGHGIEVGGVNYLIPIDAKLSSDRDVGFEAVALDQVINAAERAGKLRLIVLDACRDNPFANQMKRSLTVASRSVSHGLAQVEPDAGTLVVYAAKHGETALDGDGSNSPFAAAFIRNMQVPGVEVRRLFDNVRDDVLETTKRRQQPFSYGSISGKQDFYFVAAR